MRVSPFFCSKSFFFVRGKSSLGMYIMKKKKKKKKTWHHFRLGYKPFYLDFVFTVVFVRRGKVCRPGGIYMWWAGPRVMSTGSLMTHHDPAPRETRRKLSSFFLLRDVRRLLTCRSAGRPESVLANRRHFHPPLD